ncbi:MAG: hypothetical protein ACKVHO_23700 [Verrucomicrobiia bacterium]|jgi:hypothetical protein
MKRIFTILFLAAVTKVSACTIPVFRYALDRWHPDPYALTVPKAWLSSAAGTNFLNLLDERSLNLRVVPEDEKERQNKLFLPGHNPLELWSGDAPPKDLTILLDSPARQELARRILAGASAVWVMVDSGNKKADDALAKSLNDRLTYLKSVAEIPPQDPFDPESQLGPGPELKVEFSLIRVLRSDPKEAAFIDMLAGARKADVWLPDTPFAAPVFGRGRTLGAWTAADLDSEGIDEVCMYLLGACSCQVKQQNPGWDLMIDCDWDAGLMKSAMVAEAALLQEEPAEAGATNFVAEPKPGPVAASDKPESEIFAAPELVKIEATAPETTGRAGTETVKENPAGKIWLVGMVVVFGFLGISFARGGRL